MDIGVDILIGVLLLFLLGTIFRVASPFIEILLNKLKNLGLPSWIFWTLGSIIAWGGISLCIVLVGIFADKFFGW